MPKTRVRPARPDLAAQLEASLNVVRSASRLAPRVGIILGTGLGALAKELRGGQALSYEDIPHFPVSTAPGHRGRLLIGTLADQPVMILDGRFHFYEGYSLAQITYPVRLLKQMGAEILLISNAAGGLNPAWRSGDLMVITDHINLMGVNPLIGPNDERLGPRFPDMSEPYDRRLIALAAKTAKARRQALRQGVYLGLTGPNLETRAEYRMLRRLGADAVGMSTVPEVIVAAHAGLRVLGLSVITDLCIPETLKPANVEEIIRIANKAEPQLTRLVTGIIKRLG